MANIGPNNEVRGVDMLIYIDGVLIGGQKDARLRLSREMIDAGHKLSGGWATRLRDEKDISIDFDGAKVKGDAAQNALLGAFVHDKSVLVKFTLSGEGTNVIGVGADPESFTAYFDIESIESGGSKGEVGSFSGTLLLLSFVFEPEGAWDPALPS